MTAPGTFAVDKLLSAMETDFALVQTPNGNKPVFLLRLIERDGQGALSTHQSVMSPEQMQSMCSLLYETLSAQGYAIPPQPSEGEARSH